MSEQQGDKTTTTATPAEAAPAAPQKNALSDLMAAADARPGGATAKASPDLEAEALRAAEKALAEGQKALAAARAHMGDAAPPSPLPLSRSRERWLRVLLAFNVLVMIGIAILPTSSPDRTPTADGTHESTHESPKGGESRFSDPWNRALAAAERRDFDQAISILDGYLVQRPNMVASEKLSVLMALAHYSSRKNDFKAAQDYQRRADAIEKSHSLPEDLVATAKAAAEAGDQEQLRRIWARFLLQQRQVPSWLYKHVAEAYLQLGDSYRQQANAAAEAARLKELEETAAALRAERAQGGERK